MDRDLSVYIQCLEIMRWPR